MTKQASVAMGSSGFRWAGLIAAVLLGIALSGCGGGSSPVAQQPPTVTGATPLNQSTGVVGRPVITATFSEAMMPLSGASSLTVTCATPCVSPAGAVSLDATNKVVSFTLAAGTVLVPQTRYTGTIASATSLATGKTLQAPFTWTFTTAAAPTVTAASPVNLASGVAINLIGVTAAFSERMTAFSGPATFTLTCAAPCSSPTGTVALDASDTFAIFTLTAGTNLAPLTLYTATVSGATSLATGMSQQSPYIWQFTTGASGDTTRPTVILTNPVTSVPGPTASVPANTAVSVVFSEDMNPASVTAASFTLSCAAPCVSPAGTVSYVSGSRTAIFTPNASLTVGAVYTATVTTAATDLSANALGGNQAAPPAASNYVWTFVTAAAVASAHMTVSATNPAANSTVACPAGTVNATFTVPSGLRMDPSSVTTATFLLTGPEPAPTPVLASSVTLDTATGHIATFTPTNPLIAGMSYMALIRSGANGVKDLSVPANTLASDYSWTFTAGSAGGQCQQAPAMGAASTFGNIGGTAGMTNQGTLTVINGDIGTTAVSTAVTGFHDSTPQCIYTETGSNIGTVNGTIYTAAPSPAVGCPTEGTAATFLVASQGAAATLNAYNSLVAQPAGPDPGAGNLATLVLLPGVYTAAAGTFMIQGGDLTLDAQGNANAVWVFQMAQTLLVGGPGAAAPQSVLLINGAQAKNVFWQVGSAATLNAAGGGTFSGTIIARSGVSVSTAGNTTVVTVNGRLLSLGASVTLVDTVVNVPAP